MKLELSAELEQSMKEDPRETWLVCVASGENFWPERLSPLATITSISEEILLKSFNLESDVVPLFLFFQGFAQYTLKDAFNFIIRLLFVMYVDTLSAAEYLTLQFRQILLE